jgi:flagellar biosynthesis/type III secretory pathway M-ring protein FliF/YscJ
MKRFLPHIFWTNGLLLVVINFSFPVMPFSKDLTPEMSLLEETQSEFLTWLGLVGSLLFVTGVLWIVTRWLTRRFSRKTVI